MNPKPRTGTKTIRTRRHPFRNLKVRKPRPYTRLIHTKHCEILRRYFAHIALVRNRECTPFQVVESSSVEFGYGAAGADVIAILNISARVGCEEGCGALVACDFGCD